MPVALFSMRFDIRVDRRVFAYTILASVATALISGFLPALRASKADLVSAL
jgi:ABC-type lipoprotein release transport system permease subunit